MKPTNWYAVWSATVAGFCGGAVLAVSDPWGFVWRERAAEREALVARTERAERAAKHLSTLVVACRMGGAISFPEYLVFCDPHHAPVAGEPGVRVVNYRDER